MKTKLITAVVILLFTTVLWAQRNDNQGERWDTDDVRTITGTIMSVNHPIAVIKADNGTEYNIHMGPYWFWNKNDYKLTANTEATVKGEVKTVNSANELYPWEITQSGITMKFADDNGVPNWSGGKGNGRGKGNCWRNNNNNGNGWGRGNCCNCPCRNK